MDAISVKSISDEYSFLCGEKKLRILEQNLVEKDGRSYDVVRAIDPDGDETTWYFDVTDLMNSYEDQL